MSNQLKDMTGQILHNMLAVKYAGRQKWVIRCTRCATERKVDGQTLRSAERRSEELCKPCGNKQRAEEWKINPPKVTPFCYRKGLDSYEQ
jgi:hypothetical protein